MSGAYLGGTTHTTNPPTTGGDEPEAHEKHYRKP